MAAPPHGRGVRFEGPRRERGQDAQATPDGKSEGRGICAPSNRRINTRKGIARILVDRLSMTGTLSAWTQFHSISAGSCGR